MKEEDERGRIYEIEIGVGGVGTAYRWPEQTNVRGIKECHISVTPGNTLRVCSPVSYEHAEWAAADWFGERARWLRDEAKAAEQVVSRLKGKG